jgi:hypothetical protein
MPLVKAYFSEATEHLAPSQKIICAFFNLKRISELEYKIQTELDYIKTNFFDKYNETKNIQFMKDYIYYNNDVLEPLYYQLMGLKYSLNEVEYNEDKNIYTNDRLLYY